MSPASRKSAAERARSSARQMPVRAASRVKQSVRARSQSISRSGQRQSSLLSIPNRVLVTKPNQRRDPLVPGCLSIFSYARSATSWAFIPILSLLVSALLTADFFVELWYSDGTPRPGRSHAVYAVISAVYAVISAFVGIICGLCVGVYAVVSAFVVTTWPSERVFTAFLAGLSDCTRFCPHAGLKIVLAFTDGASDKFYEVTAADNVVSTRYGRRGTLGTVFVVSYPDGAKAREALYATVSAKIRKGYVEGDDGSL